MSKKHKRKDERATVAIEAGDTFRETGKDVVMILNGAEPTWWICAECGMTGTTGYLDHVQGKCQREQGRCQQEVRALEWGRCELPRGHAGNCELNFGPIDQARAEQPSSDPCPDCGQSLKGAGE